ncbi:Nif3-like dinuclear metal center hexameric protein [Cohnella zeiphila]|uniref:GTP cyclohydrolase 1 type 2 homolog n=1 Tax=Cohnella zeiphila TaxID=2761120 RepID=A0A7X0SQI1_9BACL|nr:Nif3-like dinuclear metal center hexameric protein [Cohnella zeiphila]MBB6734277.1 Nif3-like dinuclear metal center hexameric protein [Cohnella zeiphila]
MGVTVRQVIDSLIGEVELPERTVDTLKIGDPNAEVAGIAVAFMPTQEAVERAIESGANLLIAHEGVFFSHHDGAQPEGDPVLKRKKRTIEAAGLALFRLHDTVRRYRPDLVTEGLIRQLGWEDYVYGRRPEAALAALPPMTLERMAASIKEKLGIPYVRVIGDPAQICAKVGLTVGYRGSAGIAIPLLSRDDADVVLIGEGPEWETPEYVRDAIAQGRRKALLVLGHAESEEPGMRLVASRLRESFPALPVRNLEAGPLFRAV